MNRLSLKSQAKALRAILEGCSIRSVERLTGHHRDTIMRLMVKAGEQAKYTMDTLIRNVPLKSVQVDECWTYVQKKDSQLQPTENPEKIGSQYIFIAIDRKTKLVPCIRVGKRDMKNATLFMGSLRDRISGKPQLTTDAMQSYPAAVSRTFGASADYAQLVKVYCNGSNPRREGYSPVDFVLTRRTVMWGRPERGHISTSHIERLNLTLRMSSRRLTRLTNAFSKKYENLKAAMYLYFCYYNFCRIHKSLRITPAMAAGITDHIWSIEEILGFSVQKKACA